MRAKLTPENLARPSRGKLALLAVIALLSLGFVLLADEVMEGATGDLDTALLLSLRNPADLSDPIGPHWVEEMARDFTAIGGVAVLGLLVLAVAGYLWLRAAPRLMVFLFASVLSGIALSQLLKNIFDRPRPDLVPHGSYVYNASFPSGHSLMAAVVYLTLGVLLVRAVKRPAAKVYLLGLAGLITILVGVSRVYLGVHWPTDVLAGWIVGCGWALICGLIAGWLERRGKVEPERAP